MPDLSSTGLVSISKRLLPLPNPHLRVYSVLGDYLLVSLGHHLFTL